MKTLYIGDRFTVDWSNCAGFSIYQVVDNPEEGPHIFKLIGSHKYA